MVNAFFIVWRECFEAVLIIGILYSYLKTQPEPARSYRFMWGGVAAGVGLSALLAYGVQAAQTELQGAALEWFEAAMLATAAALMTHMCIWMKQHARTIRRELETGLQEALTTAKLLGVATLTALALAREGFELVMFFYGMGIEASENGTLAALLSGSAAGVVATIGTAWIYKKGLKLFNPRLFFRVTTAFLLVTASSLLLAAVRKLIQMGTLAPLQDQIWDTGWLLDERTATGQFFSTATGYESAPSLMVILVFAGYWAIALLLYFEAPARIASRLKAAEPSQA